MRIFNGLSSILIGFWGAYIGWPREPGLTDYNLIVGVVAAFWFATGVIILQKK